MERINTTNKAVDLFGAGKHGFKDGTPGVDLATFMSQAWCNTLQEELAGVVEAAGFALNPADRTQLRQAIVKMLADSGKSLILPAAVFEASVSNGEVVRWDAGNARFDEAIADGTANDAAVGIADVTNSKVYAYGETSALFVGLTPGSTYYLDPTTPGALTTIAPADAIKVGIAKSATALFVDVDRAPGAVASMSRVMGLFATTRAANVNLIDISCQAVVLRNRTTGSTVVRVAPPAVTLDTNPAGPIANGRDQAAAFGTGFVYVYYIWNGATLASIVSTQAPATGPALPAGYTHDAFVGCFYQTPGAFARFRQVGSRCYWVTQQNVLASGGATSRTAVSVASVVPAIAGEILLTVRGFGVQSNTSGQATNTLVIEVDSGTTHTQLDFDIQGTAASVHSNYVSGSELIIPNNGQSFLYWHALTFGSSPSAMIDVRGYTVPNGDS